MAKKTSRRQFLEFGLKAGLVLPFASSLLYSCMSKTKHEETTSKPLKILILGGTSFLGPHQIAYALNRGHSITTFTRGKTQPAIYKDLFNKVEQLTGDRNDDLKALENLSWDAVIDNSGRHAEWTRKSAELLKNNCKLYLYTSSTGVFYPYINSDFKETSDLLYTVPADASGAEKMEYDYGVMKANSEKEALNQFGADRTIIVRPTYMFGPADRTNRFIYWPVRLQQGGEVMLPGKKEDPVQYIDVRDVAEWMIRLIEDKNTGTYNAVGPEKAQTMYAFAEEAKTAFNADTSFVKIDDYDFLKAQNILDMIPWILPEGNNAGSARIHNTKALKNGLTFRPLKSSVKDCIDWWYSDAVDAGRRAEFETSPDSIFLKEKEIIEQWKALKEKEG
ncbi:NAD-dependent epimerase/dehydratase family protein [Formosa sp. S-31]|uniref:NAD-dependent epimerase/dehydratase family protein n=1 Tax=Formosa sp. S-31 TaxID=2790949 RepID=UPI003EBD1FC3